MAQQRLHSALAPIDILTREEMEEIQSAGLDAAIRERYRGIDTARFPKATTRATATSVNLFSDSNEAPSGPEQGDVWMIRRVVVKSSVLTDTAKYVLFRGSAPSDVSNAYGIGNLLDAFVAAGAGSPVNVGFYPSNKAVLLQPGEQIYALVTGATVGNQYQLDGEAIRCPAEMKGKLLG
jgi:hypothetical protein